MVTEIVIGISLKQICVTTVYDNCAVAFSAKYMMRSISVELSSIQFNSKLFLILSHEKEHNTHSAIEKLLSNDGK